MQVIQFEPYDEELLINEINNGGVKEDETTTKNVFIWSDQLTKPHNQPKLPPPHENKPCVIILLL